MSSEQPKEYIMWMNFNALVNSLDVTAEERASLFHWENEYRSHPHTPAPDDKEWWKNTGIIPDERTLQQIPWLQQHDAAIARTATLATLLKIKEWRVDQEVKRNCGETDRRTMWIDESEYLESLRAGEQE